MQMRTGNLEIGGAAEIVKYWVHNITIRWVSKQNPYSYSELFKKPEKGKKMGILMRTFFHYPWIACACTGSLNQQASFDNSFCNKRGPPITQSSNAFFFMTDIIFKSIKKSSCNAILRCVCYYAVFMLLGPKNQR